MEVHLLERRDLFIVKKIIQYIIQTRANMIQEFPLAIKDIFQSHHVRKAAKFSKAYLKYRWL